MNIALSLGATHSHFVNPHGLHEAQIILQQDMQWQLFSALL
jgi:D-alanyl-D-alanine carboxypeptidase